MYLPLIISLAGEQKVVRNVCRFFPVEQCPDPGGFTANLPSPSAIARYPLAGNTPAGIQIPGRDGRGVSCLPPPPWDGGFVRIFPGRWGVAREPPQKKWEQHSSAMVPGYSPAHDLWRRTRFI